MIFGNLTDGLDGISKRWKDIKQIASYDFDKIYKKYDIDLSGLKTKDISDLQNYVNLLNQGKTHSVAFAESMKDASDEVKAQTYGFKDLKIACEQGAISENQYKNATQNLALTQKTATATSKALSIALNTIANVGIMIAINAIIKGISALADKLIVTKEELEEIRDSAVNDMNELADSASQLAEEGEKLDELVAQYKKIALSTDDITSHKEELAEIQNSLVEMYGSEAESLDLLNSKYEDTIDAINRLSEAEFNEWKYKNADKIAKAEQMAGYDIRWYDPYTEYVGEQPVYLQGQIEHTDELIASLYKVKGVSEDVQDIWQNIDGIDFVDNFGGKNTLYLSGTLEDAKLQVQQLIDEINKTGKGAESLSLLTKQLEAIDDALKDIATYSGAVKQKQSGIFEPIGELSIPNIDKLKDIVAVAGDARSEWFEAFKEIQNGTVKTVDTISSALSNLAEGNKLSSSDFWELMELDTNKILTDIQMVGDEFVVNEEQLIQLKDEYINNQVKSLRLKNKDLETSKADLQVAIDQAKAELAIIGARGLATQEQRDAYNSAQRAIRQATDNLADMEDQQRRNNLLIDELNSKLGKTIEYTRKLADAYAKAFTDKIDKIIDGLEDELDTLNDQKDALNDQLDVLEAQQDELEDMISKYKDIAGIIEDEINKEIDLLKEQQQAQEDAYNARIDALKQENEERQDALEYAQKLANLENAKNNKVRVIDETRGFRYENVKEDVVKAENELADYENEQAIKALEKERDEASKIFDTQIKEYEDYLESFKDIQEEETNAENERIMTEEMGSDWREQIKNKDTNILTKYQTNFRNYNTQLSGLVNNEIASLKKSIKAKEDEISTKQKQIKTWKDYKTEVEKAIETVDSKYDDYIQKLGEVDLAEDNRETSLQTFVTTYEGYVQQIQGLQDELSDKTVGLYLDTNVDDIQNRFDELIRKTVDWAKVFVEVMDSGDPDLAKRALEEYAKKQTNQYAQGGTVDYTGLAMVHGRKNAPETVFNANDSKKLYDMIHNTPNLMADMMTKATKTAGFNLANTGNTSTSSVSIGAINVYANNPTELANGLDKQLDKYFQTKLTANYTRN